MHLRIPLVAVTLLALSASIGGCGNSSDSGQPRGMATSPAPVAADSAVASTPSPPAPAQSPSPQTGPLDGKDAAAVIAWLASHGVPVVTKKVYDETSDPNHLLGRPGGYTSKAAFQDKRVPADQYGPDVDDSNRGGSVEVYGSRAGATGRAHEVQVKLKAYGLGTEYDYVIGGVLVRVAGTVTPTQASAYQRVLGVDPQPAA